MKVAGSETIQELDSFVGTVTEIVPNSLPLSFLIAQRIYRKRQVMVSLCGISLFVQISVAVTRLVKS